MQVGRTRDRFQTVMLGIYSVAADISVCPGDDSASKNEYQDIPGGKGGRCVRVTNLPPSCAECLVIWSLNRPRPSWPHTPAFTIQTNECTHNNIVKHQLLQFSHLTGPSSKSRKLYEINVLYDFVLQGDGPVRPETLRS